MKLIEMNFTYDEGWQMRCERNGVMKTSTKLISVDKIVSISKWEGTLLHEGRSGTQVRTIDGRTHVDADRSHEDFLKLLNLTNQW
jgi:hypothetical protein